LEPVNQANSVAEVEHLTPSLSIEAITPRTPPKITEMRRRVGAVATVAVAMTSVAIANAVGQAPEYEGSFELKVKSVSPSGDEVPTEAITSPTLQAQNQSLPIAIDEETQIRILRSPKVLDEAIQQLHSQKIELDYDQLNRQLEIAIAPDQSLQISYRDTEPQRVQAVLNQLAETYVSYSQDCRSSDCKGLEFIATNLPLIQERMSGLRQQMQQFQQQHGVQNLEIEQKALSYRSNEILRQEAEMAQQVEAAKSTYMTLQQRLALPAERTIALNLLNQDAQYRMVFADLQAIESQIVAEFSHLQTKPGNVQVLYTQHQILLQQLHQTAQGVLERHLTSPELDLQDPLFQEPAQLELLQQWVSSTHYLQVLQTRQQTIAQIKTALQQQRHQLTGLIHQYSDLQLKLQTETQILQEYLNRRAALLSQSAKQPNPVWQVVASPELMTNSDGEPTPVAQSPYQNIAAAAVLGVLMGIAVATAIDGQTTRIPSYAD
jgi:uncharacterized protein involved in exopolysaccharide biosynthesis